MTHDTFPILELPQPLVEDILLLALDISWNRPTNVFLLCHSAYEYLRPKYLKRVCLGSIEQVKDFAESDGIRQHGGEIKSLRIQVGGAVTNPGSSRFLGNAIRLAPNVENVELVLFSLRVDVYRHELISGLCSINPKRFTWTSPDPDHQFIIAIFSSHLPPFLSQYSNLVHLSLSNISFAPLTDPSRGEPPYHGWNTFDLPRDLKRQLQMIEIRRAVFVEPRVIVDLLLLEERGATPERRSVTEMIEMYRQTMEIAQHNDRLETAHDTDTEDSAEEEGEEGERKRGCKVILEDVYLESDSDTFPRKTKNVIDMGTEDAHVEPLAGSADEGSG
ncbi:hypothetical protein QFC21_002779 [Naganishia friedmannii]|uniref:Uncharacterized protein n=1 Tax=Naganishia friedmannii TaxID=89922 RepID=A0ACC2VTI0_9TREE|nr:hypothetical protein QFC21_002779 [Naganishia friedmannii]